KPVVTHGLLSTTVEPLASRASSSMAFAYTGFAALRNTPARRTDGTISRNSSMFFALDAADIRETPVMFPSGRAKLGAMQVSIGSAAIITVGISRVACFAANAQGT